MSEVKKLIQTFSISPKDSILTALKRMDISGSKLLMVNEDENLIYKGLLSIGDIQRAIIKNVNLENPVSEIMRNDYVVASPPDPLEKVKEIMLKIRSEFMPVIDEDGSIVHIYLWKDFFGDNEKPPVKKFDLPVVIMAGGLGTRLRPMTNVLPKPLIPLGSKSMIEDIIDNFAVHGVKRFFISVNYKADLIEYYLNDLNLEQEISCYREDKPMGTGGSLGLLKDKLNETFFVSNCDILIDQDYSEILDYHKKEENEITLISVIKTYPIAYGTLRTGENGRLIEIQEKPELTFQVNSGMYILEPHLLSEIPENKYFHITHLIEKLLREQRTVGVFPISQNSWTDIGSWPEYIDHLNRR